MTLGGVRTFIGNKLTTLGLKQWADGFNRENIPANILNKSFHIEHGTFAITVGGQQTHEFRGPMTVRVFFSGYRDPLTAKDTALQFANTIFEALLAPDFRLSEGTNLKDIRPVSVVPVPLAASNDNSLILELVFELVLHYRFT